MARKTTTPPLSEATDALAQAPQFDRHIIRELAQCFARAAVDEAIQQQKELPRDKKDK